MSTDAQERSIYCDLAEIPVYSSAHFVTSTEAFTTIQISTSVVDFTRNTNRSLSKTIFVTPTTSTPSLSHDLSDAVATFVSPSGALLAILREVPDTGDGPDIKRYVEIWKNDRLVAYKDVTKMHGSFYTHDVFASLSFSPSETAFVYNAEANPPNADNLPTNYDKYRYIPHFGEKFIDRKRPSLFLVCWEMGASTDVGKHTTAAITVMALSPWIGSNMKDGDVSFGQAVFADENTLYITGYEKTSDGRILGLHGCFNHPSSIWKLTFLTSYDAASPTVDCHAFKTQWSRDDCSERSPRIVGDGSAARLVWLSHAAGGPHHSCANLHVAQCNGGSNELIVVETVNRPEHDSFPGLFVEQLPTRSSLIIEGSAYIATHTVWGTRRSVVLISLETGNISRLVSESDEFPVHSWTVMCTDGHSKLICSAASPTEPNVLILGTVISPSHAIWRVIDRPDVSPKTARLLKGLSSFVVAVPDRHPTETLIVQQSNDGVVLPCITMPHGGPHTTSTATFSPYVAALALQGYTVSLPNYTGSLGYGKAAVEQLMGLAGDLDVKDCLESVKHLISLGIAKGGPGFQYVHGGSHGGFIGAHLIGQYPEIFTAAALRNPVISAGEMISTTDIPDWCYYEFGLSFPDSVAVTPGMFDILYHASPISHVDDITAPVLLLMGEQDQRVPPAQGKSFYHALRGLGKTVDMLWFPGKGHGLEQVEPQRLCWEATVDWFKKYGAQHSMGST